MEERLPGRNFKQVIEGSYFDRDVLQEEIVTVLFDFELLQMSDERLLSE